MAPALGALSGTLVTFPGLVIPDQRLSLVAFLVALFVVPALVAGKGREMERLMKPVTKPLDTELRSFKSRPAIVRMWTARLLVQIAEAALFAFLLFGCEIYLLI